MIDFKALKNLPEYTFIPLLALSIVMGLNPILIHFFSGLFLDQFSLPFVFNFYNLKRMTELGFLTLTGLLILLSKSLRLEIFNAFRALSHEVQIAILAFFLLGVLSATFAIYREPAFFGLAHDFLWFISGLLISRQIFSERSNFIIYTAFSLSISLYVIFALSSYFLIYHQFAHEADITPSTLTYLTIYPQFLNPRFLAQAFILTWPLLLYVCVLNWKRKPALSVLLLFISSYWMTLALENESRAIFLSAGCALVGLLFLARKHLEFLALWLKFLLASVGLSILLSSILFSIGLDFPNPFLALLGRSESLGQYTDRIALWAYTLKDLIFNHPFLGVGPLNFAAVPNPGGVAHPHNAILKIAAEWGVPAALLFCFLLLNGLVAWIKFFRKLLKKSHPDSKTLLKQSTLTLILIGGILDAMISGNTVMPLSQLLLAIFFAWMYGMVVHEMPHTPEKFARKTHVVFCVLVAVAMTVVIFIALDDLFRIHRASHEGTADVCEGHPSCTLPPLMWFPEQTSDIKLWM